MALSLSSLKTTKTTNPPIFVIYGVDGVGKTSLAAEFPDPIYISTPGERPPSDVELPTPGEVDDFGQLLDLFGELLTEDHDRKTVIVDSLDGLEPLVWQYTCQQNKWASIEEPGYGRGYVEADNAWREYLAAIQALAGNGIAVVQLAHPEIVRFESPTSDPYSRYGIKLHKRAAALVRESADVVGFVNYRTTLKSADAGFGKKVTHGEGGGDRQIHLEERPGYVAKNRYGAPATVQFRKGQGYAEISKFFPAPVGLAA